METKWFAKSLTVWGLVVTGASQFMPFIGPLIGIDVTPGEIQEVGTSVSDVISSIGTAAGLIMAFIGRKRAKGPLSIAGA